MPGMPDNSKEIHELPDLGDVQRGDVLAASRNGKTGRVSLDALLARIEALEAQQQNNR